MQDELGCRDDGRQVRHRILHVTDSQALPRSLSLVYIRGCVRLQTRDVPVDSERRGKGGDRVQVTWHATVKRQVSLAIQSPFLCFCCRESKLGFPRSRVSATSTAAVLVSRGNLLQREQHLPFRFIMKWGRERGSE